MQICSSKDFWNIEINKIKKWLKKQDIQLKQLINYLVVQFQDIIYYNQLKEIWHLQAQSIYEWSITKKKRILKLEINIPITQGPSIFKIIKTEIEKKQSVSNLRLYKIKFNENEGKECAYIGMTKWKIEERINEHEGEIILNKDSAEIARLNNKSKN